MLVNPYDEFRTRIQSLGNHNQKNLFVIDRNIAEMKSRLAASGSMEESQLWLPTNNPRYVMEVVRSFAGSPEKRIPFLAAYFGIQLLQMNLRSIDQLVAEPVDWQTRFLRYRSFMMRMGRDLRRILLPFMELLIEEYGAGKDLPEFTICSVGTRADQDDLDLAIIDSGEGDRLALDKLIGKLSAAMTRYAIPLHLYLSEHVGPTGYTASVDNYISMIRKHMANFVMVSELLNAVHIIGSRRIFDEFRDRVIGKYFYYEGEYNLFCEGYLRGMIGEISTVIDIPPEPESINPKRDGLRIIKGILATKKIIHGIREERSWTLARSLMETDPRRAPQYRVLEESLGFFEILRFLYQLLDVQEEEIRLDQTYSLESLGEVARLMGYSDRGALPAGRHLLATYYEQLEQVHRCLGPLLEDLEEHLLSTSRFTEIMQNPTTMNLSEEILEIVRFFSGATYWDDVTASLEQDRKGFRRRLFDALKSLSEVRKNTLMNRYVRFMMYDLRYLMKFLSIMNVVYEEPGDVEIAAAFNQAFMKELEQLPAASVRLEQVFDKDPGLLAGYLDSAPEECMLVFQRILDRRTGKDQESSPQHDSLKTLVKIMHTGSRFLLGFMHRCMARYPESMRCLGQPEDLFALSHNLLTRSLMSVESAEKKQFLADYYDIGFLRIAAETLAGASIEKTNLEFTMLSDRHLLTLYNTCKEEVEDEIGEYLQVQDSFAIYASGGRARMQAFDDDYDMIVLLHSDDEDLRKKMSRIISRMNREIARTGMLPHYRFADDIGHYILLSKELLQMARTEKESDFIEQSQLLGSRLVIGTELFENRFLAEVITPYVYDQAPRYIRAICGEIESRHSQVGGMISELDIKECSGGLRDIELLMLIFKAGLRLREPVCTELLQHIALRHPGYRNDLNTVDKSMKFLKNLRDLYRLTTTLSDELDPDHLLSAARIMDFQTEGELLHKVKTVTSKMKNLVLRIIGEIEKNGWRIPT